MDDGCLQTYMIDNYIMNLQRTNIQEQINSFESEDSQLSSKHQCIHKPISHISHKHPNSNRTAPALGLLQSDVHKYQRIQSFFRDSINQYYHQHPTHQSIQLLQHLLKQPTIQLQRVFNHQNYWDIPITQQQLINYCTAIHQIHNQLSTVAIIHKQSRYFLIITNNHKFQINQITQLESGIIVAKVKAQQSLNYQINQYIQNNHKIHRLSQISFETIILCNLYTENQIKLSPAITQLQSKIKQQQFQSSLNVEIEYIKLLMKKNIRKALDSTPIDDFNYFQLADNQQLSEKIQIKLITNKKDFDEFIKKKRKRKGGKFKSLLKTGCLACLSPYYQQYNPFEICPQCHIRFHKLCYSLTNEGICDLCLHKKANLFKSKSQCFICPNKSLLFKQIDQTTSIHIFCMLTNNLWTVTKNQLKFHPKNNQKTNNAQNIMCQICSYSGQHLHKCKQESCQKYAHSSCAFLKGWQMNYDQQLSIKCCNGVNKTQSEKKRKFILNYRKYLFSMFDKQ